MASPIAHSVFGFAVAAAYFLQPANGFKQTLRQIWERRWMFALCIVLANAPDIDFVFGLWQGGLRLYHRQATHTLLWVLVVSFAVWLALRRVLAEADLAMWLGLRRVSRGALLTLLLVFVILFGHLVFDYFGFTVPKYPSGVRPPLMGIPLFWPFYENCYCSSWTLFPPMAKNSLAGLFSWQNLRVIVIELALSAPLAVGVLWWKSRRRA